MYLSWGTFKLYMYLYKRVCIISKIRCRYLIKTIRFKINFPFFFLFLMFCLGSLENIKLVLLVRLSYKKTCKFYLQCRSKYFSCKQNCEACFWSIWANWLQKQNFKIVYCSLKNINRTGRITFRNQELQLLSDKIRLQ